MAKTKERFYDFNNTFLMKGEMPKKSDETRNGKEQDKKIDLTNPEIKKKFVSYKEAKELYSMGTNMLIDQARLAGATYKIGHKVLVNVEIMDAYIEQYRIPGENEIVAKKFIPDMAKLYGVKC